jgi:hypothetical protein
MQIAAVASALGLTGTAIANDADRTPATDTSAATMDNGVATSTDANAPSGGAPYGSGSSATSVSGQERLGNTNSDNFDARMSDYAAQHNGRISRDEFMSEMGNRWDQLDTQHNGLTPYELQEIFVFTPPANAAPPRSGSDVQSGDMSPGSTRAQ